MALPRWRSALLCLALLAPVEAEARFLFHYGEDRKGVARENWGPNETEPAKSMPVVFRAPEGVYVSVGSERSFIGAAIAPRVTHLLVVDYDAQVVAFSRTNIALLQAARNRDDYVRLRLTASFQDWQAALKESAVEPYLLPYMAQQKYFDSFRKAFIQRGFAPLNDPRFAEFNGEFKHVNYLFDEPLFRRLAKLAKTGHIQAETLDLTHLDEVRKLVADLLREHLTISVLDLSNCWMEDYVPSAAFEESVREFARASAPGGVLVLTHLSRDYPNRIAEIRDPARMFHSDYLWSYYGFTLEDLRDKAVGRRFADSLFKDPAPNGSTPVYTPGRVNELRSRLPAR
jgi:hypothetical protein